MKRFVKNLYTTPVVGGDVVPSFIGQRESFDCCHCHKKTIVAVPATGVDWELVANDYKRYAQKSRSRFSEIMEDMIAMHGPDNPAVKYFQNEIEMMLMNLDRMFPGEGEEWKGGGE